MIGYQELWLLFVVSGIRSFGAGVQTPAVNSLIPQLVPEDKLMKVNGINGSIQSLTFIIAPAISGGLLVAFSLEYTFYRRRHRDDGGGNIGLNSDPPSQGPGKSTTTALADLKEGSGISANITYPNAFYLLRADYVFYYPSRLFNPC